MKISTNPPTAIFRNFGWMLLMVISTGLYAQVPPYFKGTGTTTNTIPFNVTGSHCQQIYLPTDFNLAPISGNITKIYFRNSVASATGTYNNFSVSFIQNSLTAFPNTTFLTGLTNALSSTSITLTGNATAGGWYEIPLTTPFPYNNLQTLVVEIKFTSKTGGLTGYNTTGAGNRRLSISVAPGAATGALSTSFGDFGMEVVPSSTPCVDPPVPGTMATTASGPVCPLTSVTIGLPSGTTGVGQTYQWQTSTTAGGTYTNISGVLSTPTFNINPVSTLFYRCEVICNGGAPAYSVPAQVLVTPYLAANTYTINPVGGDYPSFTAAIAALGCGIAGPIIFNVTSVAATYNEQIVIPAIFNSSSLNTVTFNGNGNTLQFNTTVSAAKHVVRLDGADFVTINGLNISTSPSTTMGIGVQVMNGSTNNTISNCVIDVSSVTSITATASGGIIASGSLTSNTTDFDSHHLVITGNTVIGGYQGIRINGVPTALNITSNVISNNIVRDFYADGIVMYDNDGGQIFGNNISRPNRVTVSTFTGIEIGGDCRNVLVNANRIHDTHNSATTQSALAQGISFTVCDAPVGMENRVTNNLIYNFNSLTGSQYGIINSNSDGAYYYHNTIDFSSNIATAGLCRGFYQTVVASNIAVRNNIINITRTGSGIKHALYYNLSTSSIFSNNNVLYVNAPGSTTVGLGYLAGTTFIALADWQTANGGVYDQNSYEADPLFVSPGTGNFTPGSPVINGIGAALGVPNDILGNPRDLVNPDPGAYDFGGPVAGCNTMPTAGIASVSNSTICGGTGVTLTLTGSTNDVGVQIQWQQSSAIGGTYTNIPAATNSVYTSGALSANTFYRARVRCVNGNLDAFSNIISITVNNPLITSTTPGNRCGPGTVNLSATTDPGLTVGWYQNATGGNQLATGNTFTTPPITGNTTFYATAVLGSSASTLGLSPTNNSCGTLATTTASDWPMRFNTITTATINTVDIIPTAAVTYTVALRNALSSANLQTATFTFTAAQVGIPQTVALGFNISTPGSYQLTNVTAGGYRIGTFTCSYPFTSSGGGFSIVGSATSSTSATNTTTYNIFYNINITEGCEGARVPVLATVVAPPALTLSSTLTSLCYGEPTTLSAITTNPGYTFSWSPGGQTASSITVAPLSNTTYTLVANDNSSGPFDGCAAQATVNILVNPTGATISTNFSTELCVSESRVLTLNPSTGYTPNAIQWESSPNGSAWTTIPTATNPTYTTPTISTTTHYRALIKNSDGTVCMQPSVVLNVANPTLTTTPGTRCGIGTVNLSASTGSGNVVSWYANATGGTPLATGNNFTTPVLNATTTYYANATEVNSNISVGLPGPYVTATAGSGQTNYGIVFDALTTLTIKSVTVYPISSTNASGTLTIDVINSAGVVLQTATFNVTGAPAASQIPFVANLNFVLSPGTNLKMRPIFTGISQLLFEPSSGAPGGNYGYPFVISDVISLTTSTLSSTNSVNNDLYYYFYNWQVAPGCVGARVPVVATVNLPLTVSGNARLCGLGGTTQLSANTGPGSYTYSWSPSGTLSSTSIANPVANPPLGTTNYSVFVTDLNSTCTQTKSISVTRMDVSMVSTTDGSRCGTGPVTLQAAASPGGVVNWWNVPTGGTIQATGSPYTPTVSANTTFYASVEQQFIHTPLSTGFGGGLSASGSAAGNMFDIEAIQDIKVTGFDIHLDTDGALLPSNISVYYKAGTYVGSEMVAANWTLAGTATGVVSAGANVPTNLPIALNLSIPAGQTYGIYIVVTNMGVANSLVYNASATSPALGAIAASDANINVRTGTVIFGPFTGLPGSPINRKWNGRVKYSFSCETGRTPVNATLIASPPIAFSATNNVICNGSSTTLNASSALNPNYTYTWTPGNLSGASVSVSPTVNTVYTVNAIDISGGAFDGCGDVGTVSIQTQPAVVSISANDSEHCFTGSSIITATPATGYGANSLQWQSSTDNINFTNIGSAIAPSYTTPTVNTTTYYKLNVMDGLGAVCAQPVQTITVLTPSVLTTVPGSRCGTGTVQLAATSSPGTNLNWYAVPTGGAPIGTGTTFTTPQISGNTNFYVTASNGGGVYATGAPNNGQNTGYTLEAGLFFDAFYPFTLTGVYVYPVGTGAGTVEIALKNSSAVDITTVVVNLVGTPAPGIKTFVPLNWNITPGTGYSLVMNYRAGGVANLVRDVASAMTGGGYPYTVPGILSITSGRCCPTAVSTAYYYFYDWQIETGCESGRTLVQASVTPSIPIVATSADAVICDGNSSTVEVTSANPGYVYTWSSIPAGFNATGPGPHSITVAGTGATYSVYGFDSGTSCGAIDDVQVTTTPNLLNLITSSTPSAVCFGEDIQLLANASLGDSVTNYVFSQSNGVYTPITGGYVIASATDHTNAIGALDDANFPGAIGFDFPFKGNTYSTLNIHSNGFVTFGSTLPAATLAVPISSTTAYEGVVAAMARDIWGVYGSVGTRTTGSFTITAVTSFTGIAVGKPIRGVGVATGATITAFDIGAGTITMSVAAASNSANTYIGWPIGEIRAETIGSAPNRIYVIQYSGFSDFATTAPTGGNLNFQIRLHEKGQVNVVYGPMTNLSTTSRTNQVGLRGLTNSDYENRLSTTNWSATTAGTANSSSVTRTNVIFPASGLTFTWSPPVGNFTYQWTGSNLSSTSTLDPVAQYMTADETYSILVTDQNTGCQLVEQVPVTVYQLPVPTAFSNAPICENADILLFASDGTTYTWTGPDNFSTTSPVGDASVYGAQQVNSGNYTVVVTNAGGCTATETIYVQVNDNPEPYEASMGEVSCNGFSDGSFQVGVNGGTPFYSFNEQSLGQTFSGFYGGLAAGTYTIDVTDLNQCVSQTPLQITVTTVPNAAPVIACPADILVSNTPGLCGAIVTYPTPVGTDICPIIGTTQIAGLPSGSTFPVGTIVNTFRVTDIEGVPTECSFSVTVTEDEDPTIANCPGDFAACNPVTWTPPTITDNCAGVVITSTHVPGTIFASGTTTVTYTATDAYNNVSTCSFDVTLYEESVAASSITSDRDFNNICLGESINLTINGGTVGEGAMWKWYTGSCGGIALPAFTGMSTINVSPTSTTTYFARAEGLCNITTCVSVTVLVSTTGPPSGVLAITNMPAFGAAGVTGTVDVTPVPGATFYRWTSIYGHINAIYFPTAPGPVETTVPSVNVLFNQNQSNYQIRVVAGNACGRTNNVSAHIRGTVPATTCLNGPVLACPNTTATYSVASCPITGTNGYQWAVTGNATITAGQGTATITVAFGAGFINGTVCVNGVSNFGLAGPQTCLTVSNNTVAPGMITGNDEPCVSGFETYSIAPVVGATSYLWTTNIIGASASGTTTTGSVQFPAGPFNGQVCVQAVSGCGMSVATCFSVTSGVAGVPGSIQGPESGICGGIGNYALSTNDANSYNWILPAGVTIVGPNGTNSVQIQFPSSPGVFAITVEAFYNCGSATSTTFVDGAPGTPTVTPATICTGGTDETYIASAAGADTYNWTAVGATYEQCTNPSCSNYFIIWPNAGGSFQVVAENDCGVSAVPFSLSTNCRISEGGVMETKVYPNPTTGQLTVEFTSLTGGIYAMTVTDMSGRTVLTEDVKASTGNNEHKLNLESVNPGMYMLYIKDANGQISVTKVTVE